MPDLAYIARHLDGAIQLGRRDPEGLKKFDLTSDGAWKSFWAAVLVLPAEIVLLLISGNPEGTSLVPRLASEAVLYAVQWMAFPVVMASVLARLGLGNRIAAMIVAYNWTGAIRFMMFVGIVVLWSSFDTVPFAVALVGLVVAAFALGYEWYVLKVATGVDGPQATLFVIIDLGLDMAIALVALSFA